MVNSTITVTVTLLSISTSQLAFSARTSTVLSPTLNSAEGIVISKSEPSPTPEVTNVLEIYTL